MTVVIAVLVAMSVWLLVPPSPDPRLRALLHRPRSGGTASGTGRRAVLTAAATAAVGSYLLLGGAAGILAAAGCMVVIPRALTRLESRGTRERREQWERQAPMLADLLAALLASGATVRDALQAAAAAMPEPTAQALRPVVSAIDLGADPASAWRTASVAAHRPIVDAIVRAHESGAPASALLARAADDIRRERRRTVEVAARSAGVRAVAPLAACFLPAFLLLGVVPVVASLAGGLLGS